MTFPLYQMSDSPSFFSIYSSPPLSVGDMSQDPRWMPQTVASTELQIYYVLSHTYIPVINL